MTTPSCRLPAVWLLPGIPTQPGILTQPALAASARYRRQCLQAYVAMQRRRGRGGGFSPFVKAHAPWLIPTPPPVLLIASLRVQGSLASNPATLLKMVQCKFKVDTGWVSAQELKLTYHKPETLEFGVYLYDGNLN